MTPTDPRPQIVDDGGVLRLVGAKCDGCGHVMVGRAIRCLVCGERVSSELFGPSGTVWSSTVVRIGVGDRKPPFALAYVDLDGGPRVLVHTKPVNSPVRAGTRVRLGAPNEFGDLTAEPDGEVS